MSQDLPYLDLARRFAGFTEVAGVWSVPDPKARIRLDVIMGRDLYGRVLQFPVTVREDASDLDPQVQLTELDSTAIVSMATGDPDAVRAVVSAIVNASSIESAECGLRVQGTGEAADAASIGEVRLREVTRQRAVGAARIGDTERNFVLRLAAQPGLVRPSSTAYQTPRLRLDGSSVELFGEQPRVLADLYWQS
ncbi:hypothetical protein CATYP_00370 [Corynebacterium atypicum]|uniref:Maltokinase N-terminal cap domain-containing protein n=1 Tax=Corynebacterium atypicum TaxID=191610 RepID=A0ABM5QKY3_9CORY|nr:hypothetical protein [Corynebacterium atypicum]AIG63413.1 hypothetical protein CATYP_00370 [Corynebacterium atypicum]